jgi:4-amino-4-deoxy-L-arabinose transferase-like glycosyltransferase
VRPALLAVLALTALLYLWDLGASGWANSFYSAAVEAGTKSWKAFFFGSFDSSSFITVDKPPASLWVMDLSARLFGLSSWSVLVPQALEGVAAVGVLYATVRRWSSAGAGLLAAAIMALTPVATLMFRFNNPDALLVLLLCASAYATTRATEKASTRWLVIAFALVGFGFITKMLQAYLVVPAMAATFFVAAPAPFWRRARQLAAGGVAMVVSSCWWIFIVMLVPAADRPYIGGSQDNSLWNLVFGYNGFGRLTGNESGSVGGGAAGTTGRWGITGLTRLFGSDMGAQISWLLPAALCLLATVVVITWRQPRTSLTRAAIVLWGGWLLVTAAVFSFGQGIIHPYYNVALAPAIGAVVGIGTWALWARRSAIWARLVMSTVVLATAIWAAVLLDRDPTWHPGLRAVVLAAGCAGALALALWPLLRAGNLAARASRVAVAGVASTAVLAAPAAYSLQTAATPHSGAIPTAGPAPAARGALRGGGNFTLPAGAFGGGFGGRGTGAGRTPSSAARRSGGVPSGGPPFGGSFPPGGQIITGGGQPGAGGFGRGDFGRGGFGGGGGLLNASTPSATTTKALRAGASGYKWAAAVVGANDAAGYELAARVPIMAIGGFNGTDPAPSLAEFENYVKEKRIHYFIAGAGFGGGGFGGGGFGGGGFGGGGFGGGGFGGGGFGGGTATGSTSSDDASEITTWVESTFTSTTIGGVTVYDLTGSR